MEHGAGRSGSLGGVIGEADAAHRTEGQAPLTGNNPSCLLWAFGSALKGL
jgi:hypothetical protein